MKLSALRATHPSYDGAWISRARDLFEGGKRMETNAARHLIQNDLEEDAVFKRRARASHYLNYCGPTGAYFAAFVGSSPIEFEVTGDATYWADLSEDCDGHRQDFNTFITKRLVEAMIARTSWWRVSFPQPMAQPETVADVRGAKLDRAILIPLCSEQVIDWDRDDEGKLLWVREHSKRQRRPGTGQDPVTIETWTEWRADGTASRWQLEYTAGQPSESEEVPEIDPPYNPIGRMPLVCLELPEHLYLMGHMASPQTESFRKRSALSWAIDRTCYAMPWFFLADKRKPPKMGAGYYGILGEKERIEWPAPPSAPFAVIDAYVANLVQEMHRVSQTMARGVDNNAAAVGRSGESKQADEKSTQIVVKAYADLLLEVAQETLEIIAEAAGRGDAPAVGGMNDYRNVDPAITIESFVALEPVTLHSVTAKREIEKRAMRAYLPDIDEKTAAAISKEIDDNLHAEELDKQPSGMEMGGADSPSMAAPKYAVGDRVVSLVGHMPGMKGMPGVVKIVRTEPPYYGVQMDGESEVHKWLSEDELEP